MLCCARRRNKRDEIYVEMNAGHAQKRRTGDKTVKTEYDFIVNPKARSGMGEMIWKMLEPELKKQQAVYKVHMTEKRKQAEKIAEAVTSDGREHTLVVLGGDGTVNEVVNGICSPEKTTLGCIPLGSSNDFVRGLGISKEPEKALDAVLHPKKIIRMDIGILAGTGGARRFLVSGGIGFDAAVCHEVCVSKWKILLNKLGLGKLSYAVVALDRLMKDRPVHMTLTLEDGRRREFSKTYFAAFMNLQYEGGGFRFCPEASPEDGMLDVIVAHDLNVPKILCLLPLAFWGKHVGFTEVTILRCRSVRIDADAPLALHTDGEPGFPRQSVQAGVMKERLQVITG